MDDEQAAAYGELRARHRRLFIESEALSELSELTHLDLSCDQQNAVYDILYRDIEAEMTEDETAMMEESATAVGGETGADLAGEEEAIGRDRAANIEQEIARFREILTPGQLARFRADLARQYSGTPSCAALANAKWTLATH